MDTVGLELIRLLPDLLWFGLATALIALLWQPIRHELLPKLANLKAGGIELSFVREAMDRAVELAEKSPKWHIVVPERSKDRVLRRARRDLPVLAGSEILWVDDDHGNNRNELRMLRQLNVKVTTVSGTEEALNAIEEATFDLVLSDIARREGGPTVGLSLLPILKERAHELPVIFYVGDLKPELGVPAGAFGITNRPDELLHLILDALERLRG